VRADDDRVVKHLEYLANGAEQPVSPTASIDYDVTGYGPYQLFEDGQPVTTVDRTEDVLYVLYRRCHIRLIDHQSLAGWASIHAAVMSVAGRRALVVGDKGAGKTTLMLRLLHDGHHVEGDETVFTRDGEAICLPRNFHVKSGTPQLIPELSSDWGDMPRVRTDAGAIITAFNPATAGFRWRLNGGPISVAVLLRANHGGASSCRSLSSLEMIAAALDNCRPTGLATASVVRACSSLLGHVPAYEIQAGDIARTAELLVTNVCQGPSAMVRYAGSSGAESSD
jgi:hypothetical protein